MFSIHINTIQGLKKTLFCALSRSKPLFNRKIIPASKTRLSGKTFRKFLIFYQATVESVWDNKYRASFSMNDK